VPAVSRVDTRIFVGRYFMACMQCQFCGDSCCSYGADIDATNVARLLSRAGEVEAFTGTSREDWFSPEWYEDAEFPGGKSARTRVAGDRCVFLNRKGRGCQIHSFCLEKGVDYHDLKPMVCSLFPVTFGEGLLQVSTEIEDRSLACIDQGPTVYRGVRDELLYYFGEELVEELDAMEPTALRA
jgi:Fe-S-cluster containining protein